MKINSTYNSNKIIDEHFDLKQRISAQKEKLDVLSNKFLELKSLAIKYKDNKDTEIKKLNNEIKALKKRLIALT